jgi:hypothetical protein
VRQSDVSNVDKGASRRFDVELFIVHPNLDADEISTALGLEPQVVHRVGERQTTRSGQRLERLNRDTRWRYSVRYEVEDQWFAAKVTELVDRLMPHGEFFRKLRSSGGTASIIVQFLGDGYFGDEIARGTLAKLLELDLDFAIECFQVPQS